MSKADKLFRKQLEVIHPKNHELLEKALFGVPAAALAFVGAYFATKEELPCDVKLLLASAFACFGAAVIMMIYSYLIMNHVAVGYLRATRISERRWWWTTTTCVSMEVISWISATLTSAGIVLIFLAVVFS